MLKKLAYSFKLLFSIKPFALVFLILLAVFSASFNALFLFFVKVLTTKLASALSLSEFLAGNLQAVILCFVCFLAVALFGKLHLVYAEKIALGINEKINLSIFEKSEKLYGLQHFQNQEYYSIINKLNLGDFAIENYLISLAPLIALIVNAIFIFLLFSFVTPFLIVALIIANLPSFFIKRKIAKIKENEISLANSFVYPLSYYFRMSIDAVSAKDLRLFSFSELFRQKINTCFLELKKIKLGTISSLSKWRFFDFLIRIFFVSVIFFLFMKSFNFASLTLGSIIMSFVIFYQLSSNISGITSFWAYLQKEFDYFDNYKKFMALQSFENGKKKFSGKINSIEFSSVSFGYTESQKILNNLSFKIEGDKVFALVGENGAGKSTIIKLMLRFLEASSGEILINGINIKEFEIESYRKQISVIFQNFMRYGLSAKDNVFANNYNDNNLELKKEKEETLQMPLFQEMPQAENTQLNMGFGGYDISGGQWQRIAVMRGLSKAYSFFIADEPTANIDPIEERRTFEMLIQKTKGLRLIITHRMGSIKDCDEILVLRNGKIEGQASHKNLMEESEYYKTLYNSQKTMYSTTKA